MILSDHRLQLPREGFSHLLCSAWALGFLTCSSSSASAGSASPKLLPPLGCWADGGRGTLSSWSSLICSLGVGPSQNSSRFCPYSTHQQPPAVAEHALYQTQSGAPLTDPLLSGTSVHRVDVPFRVVRGFCFL